MADAPREYDYEHTSAVAHRARRRLGYDHDHGEVTRWVIQLEYRLGDKWVEVVRFDHDPEGEQGHDVTADGVHMDVYRDGEKLRTEEIFPPMPAAEALTFAEDHLAEHAERYITRFEQWHGIRSP